jgi:hypothetical protein
MLFLEALYFRADWISDQTFSGVAGMSMAVMP